MAGKIFINYRRDDSAPHALAVAGYLGKRNIFIDIGDLQAGQEFETVLENKLRQCKVMLAIIGPNWVDARDEKTGSRRLDNPEDWVRLEIERALARKIPVIPVLVAGATLPSKSDLPPSLQPLLKHHGATLTTNGFRYEMAGLARDVADLTVRRPWGRMVAAASALILGSYVVAHQFGASVWWPSFGLGQPNSIEAPSKPSARDASDTAERNADAPYFLPNAREAITASGCGAAIGGNVTSSTIQVNPDCVPPLEIARAEAEAKRRADEQAKIDEEAARVALAEKNEQAAQIDADRDPALSVKPGSGQSFRDRLADGQPCPMCPEMVVVPAGTFTMGSPPGELGRDPGEVQVPVTIARPFAVGKYAVTFDQWDACAADIVCMPQPPLVGRYGSRPVINVNWDDAKVYAGWLSRKTGKTYRLLSEAEREYVTRAGTTTPFWWGSSISLNQANYNRNRKQTVPVDSFEANPWGLFNVHGNVWEWTEDCWNDSNQGNPGDGSARTTTGECSRRVIRGGSWLYNPQKLRAAYRSRHPTDKRDNNLGFRLARTLTP
jgi:formylglycine-generating enzyme required for sulfatase activity